MHSFARIWGGVWRKKRFAVGRMGEGVGSSARRKKTARRVALGWPWPYRLGRVSEGVAMDVCRGAGSASVQGLAVAWWRVASECVEGMDALYVALG